MDEYTLVIAGNWEQFVRWKQNTYGGLFIYFQGVESIRGCRIEEIKLIGTWWAHPVVKRMGFDHLFGELVTCVFNSRQQSVATLFEPDTIEIETSL